MIVYSAYMYIQIGLAVRMLANVASGISAKSVKTELADVKARLVRLEFDVCVASTTSTIYGELERDINALPDDDGVPDSILARLAAEMRTVEDILFAEGVTKKIYALPKRRFNTGWLLNEPDKLLRDGHYLRLSPIARSDVASACRCIVFGESTAVAFHILRATEDVLKSYYYLHRPLNRLALPMWGPMVDQLKAITVGGPPAGLLSTLDLIRVGYRNPTQHPEMLYEIDGAQDLFGVFWMLSGVWPLSCQCHDVVATAAGKFVGEST